MLSLRSLVFGLVAGALLIVSCEQAESHGLGPPPNCPADACQPSAVAGQGASGAGGGVGGAAAGTLTGSVVELNEDTFTQATPYNGDATIIAGQVEIAYTSATTGFDLEGLVVGQQWVFVEDQTNGASGVLSTFSIQEVPATSVTLPVISAQLMSTIASSLPTSTSIIASDAQIILLIEHASAPFVGVSVASGGPGGVIAYDEGQGTYSNQATATGAAGVIMIFNVPPSTGSVPITVVDSTSKAYSLGEIPVTAGAATIAGFAL